MSDAHHGGRFGEEGLVENYLAGRLPPEETAAFEAHLLTCERCQEEVRFGMAVRAGLEAPAPRARYRRRWIAAAAAGGLLAAAIAGVLLLRPAAPPPEVVALGEVRQPPIYLGVPVRGERAAADSLFDAAMRDYQAADYRSAAAGLRRALDAAPESPPIRFFLASSLLMDGDPDAAADHYRAVIDAGETPYRAEARYFLAKALLRQGEVDAAREQLRVIEADLDDTGAAARDLLRELEGVSTR